ncbi:heterokaryon incompatibility domain-containing protein [Trichoderma evansii]
MAALRRLRSMGDLTLWIDGICIDQTSIAERSAQVALMRDIYKQAAEVVVWLGEEDEASKTAIQYLEDIALMTVDKERMERCLPLLVGLQVKKVSDDPIGPLFKRSWFSRMWTIQEVTLPSQHQVQVLCGSILLPWMYLAIALDMLRASDYRWGEWHSAMRLQAYLSELLTEKREGSKCTDPKDRIFALFGIFQELNITVPDPDYSEPLSRIYATATVACFTNDSSMDLFYHVPSDSRRAGLPSWAVDWGDPAWPRNDARMTVTKKPFRASGLSASRLDFSEATLRIEVQGSVVDSVRQVGQSLSMKSRQNSVIDERLVWDGLAMEANDRWNLEDTAEDMHVAVEIFANWIHLAASTRFQQSGDKDNDDDESRWHDLRDTLLEYHGSEENDEECTELHSSFWSWYQAIKTSSLKASQQKPTPSKQSAALQSFLALTKDAGSRFQFKVMANCRRKRLIITESKALGLLPDIVATGDVIALISGLHMPVVLRPTVQGQFRYICHAYIHGMMNGERWEKNGLVARGLWLV